MSLLHRWQGTAALLESLTACLEITHTVTDPSEGSPDPPSPTAAALIDTPRQQSPAADTASDSPDRRASVHAAPRQAMLVFATLLQHQELVLLEHALKPGQGFSDGSPLCQCLLEMVDAVTRGPAGTAFMTAVSTARSIAVRTVSSTHIVVLLPDITW